MATQLFFIADTGVGAGAMPVTGMARIDGTNAAFWSGSLLTARGLGALFQTNTVAGPTSGIEVTNGAGGPPTEWLTPPLAVDVTISGSIQWNLGALESSMNANVAINAQLEVVDGATGVATLIDKTARTTELSTSLATNNFSETPASGVACKRGDRLRVRVFGDDAGTMASGFTYSFQCGGGSGTTSDSWLQLTEDLTFEGTPSGTQIFLTDTASIVATSSVDKEAWTSRGAGATTAVTNTANGLTAGIQCTATAGGTVIDWFTKPLEAFTLGGAVLCNLWAHESNASANASIRVEISVVEGDGTSPTSWAVGTYSGELGTSTAAIQLTVAGDDLSVTEGQRLRIRLLVDDARSAALVTGFTSTVTYAGTSGGANGDSYLTFGQTLTEFSGAEAVEPGLIQQLASIFAPSVLRVETVQPDLIVTGAEVEFSVAAKDTTTRSSFITSQDFTSPDYSLARAGTGDAGLVVDPNGIGPLASQQLGGLGYIIEQGFIEFDTSLIPVDAEITAVELRCYSVSYDIGSSANNGTDYGTAAPSQNLEIRKRDWGGLPVTTADWVAGANLGDDPLVGTEPSSSFLFANRTTQIIIPLDPSAVTPGDWTRLVLNPENHRLGVAPELGSDDEENLYIIGSKYATDNEIPEAIPTLVVTYISATVFAPSIARTVAPGLVDRSAVLFSPQLQNQVAPGLIGQSAVVFNPSIVSLLQILIPDLLSQLSVLFNPQINQSVQPTLIDQSAVLFNPQLNQQVQLGLISQPGNLFAPQLNQSITVNLIEQLAALFSPSVLPQQFITPGLINQSAVLFDPRVNQTVPVILISQLAVLFNPQLNQTVVLSLIDASGVVFPPQISQTVHTDLIDQTAVLFTPVILLEQTVVMELISQLGQVYEFTTGVVTVLPGLINQSAVLFEPQLNQQVVLDLISQLGQLFNPQLNQSVVMELIDQSGQVFAFNLGGQTFITPGLIDQSAQLFSPTLSASNSVLLELIDQTATLFGPVVNVHQLVSLGKIESTQQIFEPSLQHLIQLGLIPSGINLFAPTVNMSVDIPLISQTPTIFSPTIIYAGQGVTPDLIAQLGQLFDPQINQAVHIPLIDQSGQVFAFAIVFTGSMNWHTQHGMAGTQKGGWPGMQSAMNNAKKGR